MFFVSISSFFLILFIDIRMNYALKKYLDVEVERLTNNIVNQAINEKIKEENLDKFLNINKEAGQINNMSYDTEEINKITNDISSYVQDKLLEIDNGKINDYFILDRYRIGKFKKMKNGIICDVSLGTIRNSVLFANVGPTIPIKLSFLGQVNTNIDVKVKEYGINNILVKTNLVVKIREQVSMPITSKREEIVVRKPISIDIIKGEIPKYYIGKY